MNSPGAELLCPLEPRAARSNQSGGRLTVASTTSLTLVGYNGEVVEVADDLVPISSVASLSNTANLIDSSGADAGVPGSASTTYGVFLGSRNALNFPGELRLGPTTSFASTRSGQRYLAASGEGANYRMLGLCRLNASSQFVDSPAARFLLNYENQIARSLYANPAYNNNSAQTTYSLNSANYAPVNAGTGDFVEFLADGYHALDLAAIVVLSASPLVAGGTFWGIGYDSTTSAAVAANMQSSGTGTVATRYVTVPTSGYHKASLIGASNGASTIIADHARNGSSADVPATVLAGWIMG